MGMVENKEMKGSGNNLTDKNEEDATNMSRKSLRHILLTISIVFLIAIAFNTRDEIAGHLDKTNWLLFFLSAIVGTTGYIASGTYFQVLLKKHGETVDPTTSRKILLYAQIVKYIPGKIWALIYQASLLKGIKSTKSVILSNMDFMVISMIMVTSISLGMLALSYSFWIFSGVIFLGGGSFLLIANSCTLSKLTGKIASTIKKEKEIRDACASPKENSRTLLYFATFSTTYAASHILMLNAVFGFDMEKSSLYLAYLGLAWIAGAITMISPGGIGIKEAAFVLMAQATIESPDMSELISIAVVSRLWTITQEGMGAIWALVESKYITKETTR